MKTIPLSQGQVALVDDEDYDRLTQWKWQTHKSRRSTVYAVRGIRVSGKRQTIWMHRQILELAPGMKGDHVNGDTLDNRRANLRPATNQQNTFNSSKRSNNTSGFKGVTLCRYTSRWKAQIKIGGVNIHLGRYDTTAEASDAYRTAAMRFHGPFVRL